MPRRNELRCIGSGLLHSFVSRNNDLVGYWALGKLYLHAKRVGKTSITLDLLRETTLPSLTHLYKTHDFALINARYQSMLDELLARRAVPKTWLSGALMSIEFESKTAAPTYLKIGRDAAAYTCTLTLVDDLGNQHILRAAGWCRPHNPSLETRSTRT
ncbi:hypothetical protein [Pseudoduganella namucuonensis]|uniref:hypothetical protein n=1 Tax=Pseudoduganella namucuonensis TaxID=1035707 RepID=UPI000B862D75|nr:hypothetical protein [Pseudoduganella namucuonensis]